VEIGAIRIKAVSLRISTGRPSDLIGVHGRSNKISTEANKGNEGGIPNAVLRYLGWLLFNDSVVSQLDLSAGFMGPLFFAYFAFAADHRLRG
jgi:hypothetical protein